MSSYWKPESSASMQEGFQILRASSTVSLALVSTLKRPPLTAGTLVFFTVQQSGRDAGCTFTLIPPAPT
eukprot:1184101-Prorocentrum_minimum.AAC.2